MIKIADIKELKLNITWRMLYRGLLEKQIPISEIVEYAMEQLEKGDDRMEQLKEEYQLPVYLFHEGKNYEAYRFFGVHKIKKGTYAFRVWAPHAVGVAVAGDFNDWSETANPMTLIAPEIWEAVVDGVSKYDCYKYAIQTADGRLLMKADPYAVHQETRPGTASKVYDLPSYKWTDSDWFAPSVISAYEYGLLNGRSESSFAPSGNVTIAELLTIAARLRAIYTTGSDAVVPAVKENEAWYAPYVSYLKSQNLLDNSFEGFYLLPASRAQMAGIFAFAVPEEWYTEPNASLVTSAYASREYITDVTDKTPYRSEILLMYRRGLLSGMDAKGSFYPDRSVSRAEIAALLTRVVKPETRLTLTWTVAPYHSVKNATLASLVKAPASTSLPTSAKDTAAIDGLVRNMLARGEHTITLNYSKALTTATASALTQAFTSCVKTYCEQMYNAVSCRSYSTGKVVLTFSSTACTDKTLESYRAKALAAAIKVHDSLWESGTLSYDMSQYEIARTYFQWLCDHCRYDNAAADDSASHLAYGALVSGLAVCDGYTGAYNLLLKLEGIECTSLFNDSHIWTLATLDGTQYHIDVTWGDQYGRTDLRYFGMSEEQSYQCHPWGTADKKK